MDETKKTDASGAAMNARTDEEKRALPAVNSITVLRRLCEIADDVDVMSSRRPQDSPSASKKQRAACLACPHNPSRVFPRLNTVLLQDVGEFHASFKAAVGGLQTFNPPNKTCLACASQTVSDFEALYLVFEKFGRWALDAKKRQGLGPGA